MVKKHPYYNFSKLLSFNAVYNFLVGLRGYGKTYGAKKLSIKAALTKGDQFIYLRRHVKELAKARPKFFSDIVNEFPDWDFRINGDEAQASKVLTDIEKEDKSSNKKRKWITIGFFIALSQAQNQKSVSFPNVKTIIFDEFIIEKGYIQYLPEEHIVMLNFYNTVDRNQDKTRVFFLANSVSIMNPYFINYNIVPDEDSNKEFKTYKDGFIVCHFPQAKDFQDSVYTTRFGKFIQDTDYADYAVGNQFSDNSDTMLRLKNSDAVYMYTLETKTGLFSIWYDWDNNYYYIQNKLPKAQKIFTLVSEKMSNEKRLMVFNDRPMANLRTAFRKGNMSFDKPGTRNTFTEIFKR